MTTITEIQDLFFQGFINIFGSSELVMLLLLAFYGLLCYFGRFRVEASAMIFLPLIFGIIEDKWLPVWVKALFIIGVGAVWGLALLRLARKG